MNDTKEVCIPENILPPTKSAPVIKTREEWLQKAAELFQDLFERDGGKKMPFTHISCGWPSIMGLRTTKGRRIGEAWTGECSDDGHPHIFISPYLKDEINLNEGDCQGVLPTLVHEMVHTTVGIKEGHGKVFKKFALAVGLEGKMTSTHAGEKLRELCKEVVAKLGSYPHSGLDATMQEKQRKKQGTRMIKCTCPNEECGFTVRTTKKWLDDVGAPHCPRHGEMNFELPADADDSEDGED